MMDISAYLNSLPLARQEPMARLHEVISAALQPGFVAQLNGSMLEYVVPLTLYPRGYHTKKNTPLPYIALINQKHHIGVYAFCLYPSSPLHAQFAADYLAATGAPVDMGKACVRLKPNSTIPYHLIGQLAGHFSVDTWIAAYEAALDR